MGYVAARSHLIRHGYRSFDRGMGLNREGAGFARTAGALVPRNYPVAGAVTSRETGCSQRGVPMQMLYERPPTPEITAKGQRPADGGMAQLPLPILLRIPRFPDERPSSSGGPSGAPVLASPGTSTATRAATCSTTRKSRPRAKLAVLLLLILAVIPVAAVSREPRLLEPLVSWWIRVQEHRNTTEAGSPGQPAQPDALDSVGAAVPQKRSAWLDPNIIPMQTGELP
jgi:hypothetical protein